MPPTKAVGNEAAKGTIGAEEDDKKDVFHDTIMEESSSPTKDAASATNAKNANVVGANITEESSSSAANKNSAASATATKTSTANGDNNKDDGTGDGGVDSVVKDGDVEVVKVNQVGATDDRSRRERVLQAELTYCKSQLNAQYAKIRDQNKRITLLEKQVSILVEAHNQQAIQKARGQLQEREIAATAGVSAVAAAAATAAAAQVGGNDSTTKNGENAGATAKPAVPNAAMAAVATAAAAATVGGGASAVSHQQPVMPMIIENNIIHDGSLSLLSLSTTKKLRTLAAKGNKKPKPKKKSSLGGARTRHKVMGPKRILSCLALLRRNQKIVNASRKQVAVLADVKEKSLSCLLSGLKKQGLVEYPSKETVKITDAGITNIMNDEDPNLKAVHRPTSAKVVAGGTAASVAGKNGSSKQGTGAIIAASVVEAAAIPTTNREAQDKIKQSYLRKGKAMSLFDTIRDGQIHNRADVMTKSSISNKQTFSCLLSLMKSMGIVQYPSTTTVQLTDMCFPFGRNEALV